MAGLASAPREGSPPNPGLHAAASGADLSFADLNDVENLETAELAGADYLFADGLEGTILDINQPPADVLPADCDPCTLFDLAPPVNQ